MKQHLLPSLPFLLFYLATTISTQAQTYNLSAPNAANTIHISLDENIRYSVKHQGQTILDPSPISITINGRKLGARPKVINKPPSRCAKMWSRWCGSKGP